MQDLDVPNRFATIYIPCGTFVLVMDRDAAVEALRRCRAHLTPTGVLAFNVHLTDYDYSKDHSGDVFPGEWRFKAEKDLGPGRRLVVSSRDTGLDPIDQVWREERPYELYESDRLVRTETHAGQGRWYFRNELVSMLRLVGFRDIAVTGDYTDEPFGVQHSQTMVFVAS